MTRRRLLNIARVGFFHALALGVLVVGWSPTALGVFALCYLLLLFGAAGVNHRYFSHQAYQTSRPFQALLALVGTMAGQQGPLSWASIHRQHHRFSDQPGDPHSPVTHSLFHAQLGWVFDAPFPPTKPILDRFGHYPELRFLNRFHMVGPALLMSSLYGLGTLLSHVRPGLGTSGLQLLVWGGILGIITSIQATGAINSAGHSFGTRRFETPDASRNVNWMLPISLGEHLHNNHHRFPGSAKTSVGRWEWDPIYGMLRVLEALGLVWDLKVARPSRDEVGQSS
jgi:stearoyl-CoA desaturase (delta-9 desaturase)